MTLLNIMNTVINDKIQGSSVEQPFTKLETAGSNLVTCSSFLFFFFFFFFVYIYTIILNHWKMDY